MDKLRSFGWQQWLLILGLALSLGVTGVFAARAMQHVPRRQVDEPIQPWMTVPYIARSYRVPSAACYQALGLPPMPRDRRPLVAIARAQNRPVSQLIADLQKAIAQYRLAHPTPHPIPSPRPSAGAS
jgi:hypothetical protein